MSTTRKSRGPQRIWKRSLINLYLLVAGAGYHVPCHSISYDWPVTTMVSIEQNGANTDYIINVKYSTVRVNRPDWTEPDSMGRGGTTISEALKDDGVIVNGTVIAFKDNYVREYASIGRLDSYGGDYQALDNVPLSWPVTSLAQAILNKYPKDHKFTIPPNRGVDDERLHVCSGATTMRLVPSALLQGDVRPYHWGGGLRNNNSGCLTTPPISQWCALVTPTATLDFGTWSVNEANKTTYTNIQVTCTAGLKYALRLTSGGDIPLSNGMSAMITADNQPVGSTLTGLNGINEVRLGATLSGDPTASGPFSGTGVLYLSYP